MLRGHARPRYALWCFAMMLKASEIDLRCKGMYAVHDDMPTRCLYTVLTSCRPHKSSLLDISMVSEDMTVRTGKAGGHGSPADRFCGMLSE